MGKLRDLQVAEDIGKKAALGYFDVEFTMFGCAYLNKDEIYYKISPNKEDIYAFIEKANLEEIYPSNVMKYSEKCPVPSGMQELIAQDVKLHLAQKLQEKYKKDLFEQINELAQQATVDNAKKLLWQEAEELEGVFEEEKLKKFEELVDYCYSCKKIVKNSYSELKQWIREERKNMEDDIISKDLFEKTFYGLAYEEDGKLKYNINAQMGYIYEKVYEQEKQGIFMLPVYSKTYWYNYTYRLSNVKEDFKKEFLQTCNGNYIAKIKKIKAEGNSLKKENCQKVLRKIEANCNVECKETLLRYGYHWGLLAM